MPYERVVNEAGVEVVLWVPTPEQVAAREAVVEKEERLKRESKARRAEIKERRARLGPAKPRGPRNPPPTEEVVKARRKAAYQVVKARQEAARARLNAENIRLLGKPLPERQPQQEPQQEP